MQPLNNGARAMFIISITTIYCFVILLVHASWVLPGIIGSFIIAGFYLAVRRVGDYHYRFWLTYGIGIMITAAVSYFMVSAPVGICIANAILMPALMCGVIHVAHEVEKGD